ncbi:MULTISPECIES: hypothetical protein [unclassified Pseudomonas]|uniref:hypothetical protein n=1 Tax=unclassified Pseudomonas TaxID=196821 RepID=UPI002449D060|nr:MULTISPECIES: hypothetical protein [unclassified Pseudomonas]MDG9927446.1 hypothetical protein [Pseudomonas sp. GD04042]MDH0482515.1 hypothetical protein [Pseudomonas sp. GD04015]MDH0602867.1 hypothetical protein [Pseudomonas sp. GD03869]
MSSAPAKALALIEKQIRAISQSIAPDSAKAAGMLEMALAAELIDDLQFGYWMRRIEIATSTRRQILRYRRNESLIGSPA